MTRLPEDRYTLIGVNGSPYSMKMRAILRYRRLPFNWVIRTTRNTHLLDHIKPALIPVLYVPGDEIPKIDSTPMAYMLEKRHPGQRSIIPEDPVQAFFCHIIEDMADEWLTKPMFHYRWMYEADIKYAMQWIIDERFPDADDAERQRQMDLFASRQIGRMPLVGCTEENRSAVEGSYHRILGILEGSLNQHKYLFGSRPSLADFGLFGQLTVLATDPTPLAVMRGKAQQLESWLRVMEDTSGIEGDWHSDPEPSNTVKELLSFAGEVYLPFLEANKTALEKGAESFKLTILGHPYSQGVFSYQVKCLDEIKRRYQALAESDRERAAPVLKEAGILIHL